MQSRETRRLEELTIQQLRCKHAITGVAPASKMCANCYECGRCEYDQMLEDVIEVYQPIPQPVRVARAA
jgi:hypothetical protein